MSNTEKDRPGTWLFGWFLLFVVIATWQSEGPVAGAIITVIVLGFVIRYAWNRSPENPRNQ